MPGGLRGKCCYLRKLRVYQALWEGSKIFLFIVYIVREGRNYFILRQVHDSIEMQKLVEGTLRAKKVAISVSACAAVAGTVYYMYNYTGLSESMANKVQENLIDIRRQAIDVPVRYILIISYLTLYRFVTLNCGVSLSDRKNTIIALFGEFNLI